METAEEARNAPRFEASAPAPGLLAALQFNPFVPTQEEVSVTREKNNAQTASRWKISLPPVGAVVSDETRRCSH